MKWSWGKHALIVSIGLTLLLPACGNLPKPEMQRVETTSIALGDSRFGGKPAIAFESKTHCSLREHAAWKGYGGRAEIYVASADEGCALLTTTKSEEELALVFKWLKKTGVQFQGDLVKTETRYGEIWGRRFSREARACYFFRHDFEAHHFSFYSDPTTFMAGYFCAPPGVAVNETSIQTFISSISLVKDSESAPPASKVVTKSGSPPPNSNSKHQISGRTVQRRHRL